MSAASEPVADVHEGKLTVVDHLQVAQPGGCFFRNILREALLGKVPDDFLHASGPIREKIDSQPFCLTGLLSPNDLPPLRDVHLASDSQRITGKDLVTEIHRLGAVHLHPHLRKPGSHPFTFDDLHNAPRSAVSGLMLRSRAEAMTFRPFSKGLIPA